MGWSVSGAGTDRRARSSRSCHRCPLRAASPGSHPWGPPLLQARDAAHLCWKLAPLPDCPCPPWEASARPAGIPREGQYRPSFAVSRLPPGQAREESANRPEKAPCRSGAGTRGRKAMPTAGPSLEAQRLGMVPVRLAALASPGVAGAGRVPPTGQCGEIRALVSPLGAGGPLG